VDGVLEEVRARVLALIDRLADGTRDDRTRDALLRELLVRQRALVAPHARMLDQLGAGEDPLRWPALPTDVFRFARVAAHAAEHDERVFRTSGTTAAQRGQSCLRGLEAYDRAAQVAARYALFPDLARMKLCVLAPSAAEAPDSSLSYMLGRFGAWFADGAVEQVLVDGALDVERLERALSNAASAAAPIALLGTSFAFVHAEDALGARRFALPAGSRIMQTGGFKGRSRSVEPAEMLALLRARYGVPEAFVVQEYGMTELGSQLYETTLRDALLGRGSDTAQRRLWWPGWVRVTLTDPDTLLEAAPGAEGLVRIDDLANVDTVAAIQTSDRGRLERTGLLLLGRAEGATPRGCSLAIDAVLGAQK